MFTIEQLNDLHARLGSARYDSYLADGHSEYVGQGGHKVVSPPVHEVLPVAGTGQRETFLEHLRRHERGETTYLEMSRGLALSGIEKWAVDTGRTEDVTTPGELPSTAAGLIRRLRAHAAANRAR
jgi:uncharacterized protein YbcV (DUF1398 family)